MRKKFEAGYKVRVALEAVKGEKTLAQRSIEQSTFYDFRKIIIEGRETERLPVFHVSSTSEEVNPK